MLSMVMAPEIPMVFVDAEDVDMPLASGSGLSSFQRPNAFHPASFSRQFLGSPISWRAGSFGSRFYPTGSPGQLLAPFE
jgi:transcription factor SFP1